MNKQVIKFLCALLTLIMVGSAMVCLAQTEQEKVIEGYEKLNDREHTVYYSIYEYPLDGDGQRLSGKPIEDGSYTEPHTFENGVCVCGFVKPVDYTVVDDDEDDDEDDDTAAAGDTTGTEQAGENTDENIYTTSSGITVTKGAPVSTVLKDVLAAVPANAEVKIAGVEAEVADKLIDLIKNGGSQAEILETLKSFPVQQIDGVDCYVVTLSYTDANNKTVTENYAFSTLDGSLVKVF